jgi:hypothetical protein
MRHPIFIFCVAAAMVATSAVAADAISLNGNDLDGKSYGVTLYSSVGGIQEGRVIFLGDRARVYLANGMFVTLRLADQDIGDPNFISATSLDGVQYRMQLKGTLTPLGPAAGDAGTPGVRPHPGPH